METYATVEEYRADTGDETTPDARIETSLEQQSAKLRADCRIAEKRVLTEDQKALARFLVVDACRKQLVPVALGGVGDVAGASQVSFTADGFQSSVTLSNPTGTPRWDIQALKAFKRSLGTEQRMGYVWPGGVPC